MNDPREASAAAAAAVADAAFHHNDDDDDDDGMDGTIQLVSGPPEQGPGLWSEDHHRRVFDRDYAYYCSGGNGGGGGGSSDSDSDGGDASSSWRNVVDSVVVEVAADDDDEADEDQGHRAEDPPPVPPRSVRVSHVDYAIDCLEKIPGTIDFLEVALNGRDTVVMEDDDDEDDDFAASLHWFVDLLDVPEHQSIRELIVCDTNLDQYGEGSARNDIERLLRDVVPTYRTLQNFTLAGGSVDAPLLQALTYGLPTTREEAHNDLWQLEMDNVSMDVDGLRVVANDMIRRNVLIRSLYLDVTRFNSAATQMVCRNLRHNTRLRWLFMGTNDIMGATLKHVAGPHSPLRYLSVGGNWTQEGISELASQLRTNTRMLAVSLSGPIVGFHPEINHESDDDDHEDDDEEEDEEESDDDVGRRYDRRWCNVINATKAAYAAAQTAAGPLLEMLKSHNYTLQHLKFVERRAHLGRLDRVTTRPFVARRRVLNPRMTRGDVVDWGMVAFMESSPRGVACIRWNYFGPYLRRNRRIRQALKVWEPVSYHVNPISLWPCSSFELVSDLPTLLFRLLRRGNLKALCEQVVVTKKRRRDLHPAQAEAAASGR